jgi:predicted Zn-dependent protease
MPARLSIVWLLLCLSAVSCATVTPFGTGDGLDLHEDERRLWNRGREEQKRLDSSGQIYEDPALSAYINELATRLLPQRVKEKGIALQIKIIKSPLLNAFALPQGAVYIHTGMLARLENEAQLATLLGHEAAHVINRHALQHFRMAQNTAATLATLQIAFMPFGIYGSIASVMGALGATAAISGYSQASEQEADREGLALIVAAGFDPNEAPRLFNHLKREIEEKTLKEPFFFGTHPRVEERQRSYTRLLESKYADVEGIKGEERFDATIANLLLDNAAMDLSMGRFALAQESIERFLRKQPLSAKAHFQLGEVFRVRNETEDMKLAEASYTKSIKQDPFYANPHRGLGLIWLKQGHKRKAREAFETYLSLAPQASDRGYVEKYLDELLLD